MNKYLIWDKSFDSYVKKQDGKGVECTPNPDEADFYTTVEVAKTVATSLTKNFGGQYFAVTYEGAKARRLKGPEDHAINNPPGLTTGEIQVMFGKHKGKLLSEIPTGYLDWLLSCEKITQMGEDESRAFLSVVREHLKTRADWRRM